MAWSAYDAAFDGTRRKKAKKVEEQDRKRRETNPTFREQSRASRIQYAIPFNAYSDKEGSDSTEWEKKNLKDLPIKGYGRSYNDKFDRWASEQGIKDSDKGEFRKFLDYQERQQFKRKENTRSVPYGAETKLPGQVVDEIIASGEKRARAKAQQVKQTSQQEKAKPKVKPKQPEQSREGERDGVFGFLDRTLGRLSAKATEDAFGKEFAKDNQSAMKKVSDQSKSRAGEENRKRNRTIERKAQGKLEKGSDIAGSIIGEVAPYVMGGYGAAGKALKATKATRGLTGLKRVAAEGATAGAIVGAGKAGVRELTDEEYNKKDVAKLIGTEVALGVAGDVGGALVGKLAQRAIQKLRAGKTIEQVAKEEKVPAEKIAAIPDLENRLRQTQQKQRGEGLQSRYESTKRDADFKSFQTDDIPKVELTKEDRLRESLASDPFFGFAQQGKNIKSRPNNQMIDPVEERLKRDDPDRLQRMYEDIVGISQDPKASSEVLRPQAEKLVKDSKLIADDMTDQEEAFVKERLSKVQNIVKEDGLDNFRNRDLDDDDLNELMSLADDLQTRVSSVPDEIVKNNPAYQKQAQKLIGHEQATETFKVNKDLQQQAKAIQEKYGKIIVPKSNKEDWFAAVPPRFRANSTETGGSDLYAVADDLGMDVDGLVTHLQNLDQATKTTRKSMMPKGMDTAEGIKKEQQKLDTITKMLGSKYRSENKGEIQTMQQQLDEALALIENPQQRTQALTELDQQARAEFRDTDYARTQDDLLAQMIADGEAVSNPTPDMIFQQLRGENDPQSLEELTDIYGRLMDKQAQEPDLKQLLDSDPRIREMAQSLAPAPNQVAATQAIEPQFGEPDVSDLDNMIAQLMGPTPEIQSVPTKVERITPTKAESITPAKAERSARMALAKPEPKITTSEDANGLRLNVQPPEKVPGDNSMFSYSDHDVSDVMEGVNSLVKPVHKMYEGLVNDKHKFEIVSKTLMKENKDLIKADYQTKIDYANANKMPEEAKRLEKELKYLHKSESPLVKSAENEKAAYLITQTLIESTLGEANKVLNKAGISIADAFEYQAAKNLDWFMHQGGHDNYTLPKGWDAGRLVDVVSKWRDNEPMKVFGAAVNEIRLARLDHLTNSGLKSTTEYADLARNPHYIPMVKDQDWSKSAIERSLKQSGPIGSATPNVRSLSGGDENFFKNPVESLVSATYTSVRNSLRNQTHAEIANLAKLDKEGRFIRRTDKSPHEAKNVIEYFEDGKINNYEISNDLAEVIETMRSRNPQADIGKSVTSLIGGLKTTGISYNIKALTRDWTQAWVNSDGNPLSYAKDMVATFSAPKKSIEKVMKEGGAFHNAFLDNMGSYENTAKLAEKFAKENRAGEIVQPGQDLSKKLGKGMWNTLTAQWQIGSRLGNYADSAPRLATVKQVDREFMPAIQEMESRLASLDNDFEKDVLTKELSTLKQQHQQEKIYRARDVINYQRRGGSGFAGAVKDYWNFANTATQSVDRYFRQMRKKPLATIAKTMTIAAPMMAAQEIAYRAGSERDQAIYDDTPDFLKNTTYVFVVNGKRVMIPKPFEVSLVTSPIEGILNSMHNYDEASITDKAKKGITRAAKELIPLASIFPGGISLFQPALEVSMNKKMFNKKPISYYDQYERGKQSLLLDGVAQDEASSKFTSDTAKALGGEAVNADYLEHMIKGYGGDLGKFYLSAADTAIKPSGKNQEELTQNLNPMQDFLHAKEGKSSNELDKIMKKLFRPSYVDKEKVPK